LVAALRGRLRPDIPVIEMDCNINDPEFADRCAESLLDSLKKPGKEAAYA
jgi:hypothetical protein